MLELLARLIRVIPPTLHPHLPPALVDTVLSYGSSDTRKALFALLHAGDNSLAWIENLKPEFHLEALGYAILQSSPEKIHVLFEKSKDCLGWNHQDSQLSLHAIRFIGVYGLRHPSERSSCINVLSRALYWSDGEVSTQALLLLLDLLYIGDLNEGSMQILLNLLGFFSQGKRYESNFITIAYAILRQVLGNISNPNSPPLVIAKMF